MTKVKPNKHDRYVIDLCRQIRDEYDDISTHVPIQNEKRILAEIDVLAEKDGEYDVFEVKCSYRISKAKRQAKKIRKHADIRVRHAFFFCGSSQQLVLL